MGINRSLKNFLIPLLLGGVALLSPHTLIAENAAMRTIPAGSFRPFDLPKKEKAVRVRKFLLDVYPVSEADYRRFLAANSAWQKNSVPEIKADARYLNSLAQSQNDPQAANIAMTYVSWYAARAYCHAQQKRLPSLYEWEYAATYNNWDQKAENKSRILAWFGKPNDLSHTALLGAGLVSPQGVHDLHALIWEWVDDFNSSSVTGDARNDTDVASNLFCGASTLSGSDLRNYPAYMRYGMRSSLRGSYTGHNLGFRCAKDIP